MNINKKKVYKSLMRSIGQLQCVYENLKLRETEDLKLQTIILHSELKELEYITKALAKELEEPIYHKHFGHEIKYDDEF